MLFCLGNWCTGLLGHCWAFPEDFSAKEKSTFCRDSYFRDTCSLHPHWGVLRGECCGAHPGQVGGEKGTMCPERHLWWEMVPCLRDGGTVFIPVPCHSRWLMLCIQREASNICDPTWWALSLNKAFQPQTTDFLWIRLIIQIIVSLRALLVGRGPVSASSAGSSPKVQQNELCLFSAMMLCSCRYGGWIRKGISSAWNLLQEGKQRLQSCKCLWVW